MLLKHKLWNIKQKKILKERYIEHEGRKDGEILKSVEDYLEKNQIESVRIWIYKYRTKRLSFENKLLFFYNTLATREDFFLSGLVEFSLINQVYELKFLCDTPERQKEFINNFLGKSKFDGIIFDTEEYRKFQRESHGRGKEITLNDFKNCINYSDLKKSNWEKLHYLMQELYLKPIMLSSMAEEIYDSLMQGLTIKDIFALSMIEPYHPLSYRTGSINYAKEKAEKYWIERKCAAVC